MLFIYGWKFYQLLPYPFYSDKITEQFVPGSSSEVLITSADSRIRAVNGVDLIHKFKGNIGSD